MIWIVRALLLVAMLSPLSAFAQGAVPTVSTKSGPFTPLCPEQHNLAITTATGLTLPTGISSARGGSCVTQTVTPLLAVVCAKNGTVNYTLSGSDTPTTSVGSQLFSGSCISLIGINEMNKFQGIAATGGATLDVTYAQ